MANCKQCGKNISMWQQDWIGDTGLCRECRAPQKSTVTEEAPAPPNVPMADKDFEPPIPQHDPKLVGIRGWLILPAIGLVLSLIMTPFGLIAGLQSLDSKYAAYSYPLLFVNAVIYIWILVAAIQFFKKRSTASETLIGLL